MNLEPMTEMTGYDFVLGVLSRTNFEVAPLVELARSTETEWLEFKAATVSKQEDLKFGENDGDARWHVAKALIAMANSSGGAVIIGLSETRLTDRPIEYVSLEASGLNKTWDEFARKFNDQILFPKKGWKTGKNGTWHTNNNIDQGQFKIHQGTFENKLVAIVLVKPITAKKDIILVGHNPGDEDVLLRRREGDTGGIEEIKGYRKISESIEKRSIIRNELINKLDEFAEKYQHETNDQIEEWIENYAKKCIERDSKDFIDTHSIVLSGAQRPVLENISQEYQQLAIENIDDYYECDDYDTDHNISINSTQSVYITSKNGIIANSDLDDIEGSQIKCGSIFDLIYETPQAVILGESGSGKSWTLRFLRFKWATEYKPKGLVTVYSPLVRFIGDFWSLFKIENVTTTQIRELAKDGKLTLLLDGLNECRPSLLEACILQIRNALTEFPRLRIILTSRTIHFKRFLEIPVFSLLPMSEDQQIRFLERRLDNPNDAYLILDRIRKQNGVRELSSNPSFLKLIANLSLGNDETLLLPRELHLRLLHQWYEREKTLHLKNGTSLNWDFSQVKILLTEFAFSSRMVGYFSEIDINWTNSFFVQKLKSESEKFLSFISQSPIFSSSDDLGYLKFGHESIQETLAGDFLIFNPKLWTDVVEVAQNWRMVAVHVVTSEQEMGAIALKCLERIDPWLAICAQPWDSSILDNSDWTPSKNWLDSSRTLAISYAMKSDTWRELAKSYLISKLTNIKQINSCIELGLFSGNDFSDKKWDDKFKSWFTQERPSSWNSSLFSKERLKRYAEDSRFHEAFRLFKFGLLSKEDISYAFDCWKSSASIGMAAALIHDSDSSITWDDFIDRREDWIKSATPQKAERWINAGLATVSEFESVGWAEKSFPQNIDLTPNFSESALSSGLRDEIAPDKDLLTSARKYGFAIPAVLEKQEAGGYDVSVCGYSAFLPRAKSGTPFGGNEVIGKIVEVEVLETNPKILVKWAEFGKCYEHIKLAVQTKATVTGRVMERVQGGFSIDLGGIWGCLWDIDTPAIYFTNWLKKFDERKSPCCVLEFEILSIEFSREFARRSIRVKLANSNDDMDYYLSLITLNLASENNTEVKGVVVLINSFYIVLSFGIGIHGSINRSHLVQRRGPSFASSIAKGDIISCLIVEVIFLSGKLKLELLANSENHVEEPSGDFWSNLELDIGDRFTGTVINGNKKGYLIEFRPGVNGQLLKSYIPSYIYQKSIHPGKQIEVVVSNIDIEKKRMNLVFPTLQELGITRDSQYIGCIYNENSQTFFVELVHGVTGILSKSDSKTDPNATHKKVGDNISVKVKRIDLSSGRIRLGSVLVSKI